MKERLGYGNEHEPRDHETQDRDWRLVEMERAAAEAYGYDQYVEHHADGFQEEEEVDHQKGRDHHGEEHADGFEAEEEVDHQKERDHHSEEHADGFEVEAQVDHQEESGAESDQVAARFRPHQRRSRGRIQGRNWAAPFSIEFHTPKFVRAKDILAEKPAEELESGPESPGWEEC